MLIAADSLVSSIAETAKHRVLAIDKSAGTDGLRDVDAILLEGSTSWERIRAWRLAGVHTGIVVYADVEPPADRPMLEPVVLLRTTTASHSSLSALDRSLAQLQGARALGAVPLAGGRFDPERSLFWPKSGPAAPLTELETRLLAYLAARPGRAIDREELQEQVWDHRKPVPTKAVDMAVARLRDKIEPHPSAPITLLTVRGVGYRVGPAPNAAPSGRPPFRPQGPLFGREALVCGLVNQLSLGPAALLLSGPPGVGKSRIAHEVASRLAAQGLVIRQVDLDTVPDGLDPAATLATSLDLEPVFARAGTPEERLGAVIEAAGESVWVVDHGEQRLDIVSALNSALEHAGRLLVASQVTIDGLELRLVPPLDEEQGALLLIERAGVALDEETALALVPLLDGLPLALVLCAPLIASLGADGLRAEIGQRLRLLSPSGASRHGSLGQAIAAAIGRLGDDEVEALRVLCLFRGTFSLADAGCVLDDAASTVSGFVVRGVLARQGSGYRVMHAVRDYLFALSPPPASAVGRYLAWAVARAVALEPQLVTFQAREAETALLALHADLRAALSFALANRSAAGIVALFGALDAILLRVGTEADRQALVDRVEPILASDIEGRAQIAYRRAMFTINSNRSLGLTYARAASAELADRAPALAARAHLLAAEALLDDAPADALEEVLAIYAPTPALRARARAMEILCREALGTHKIAETADLLCGIVDELVSEGALWDAARVALRLERHFMVLAPHRALHLLEQLTAWSAALHDPRITGYVELALGTRYGEAGQFDEAKAAFQRAQSCFSRSMPTAWIHVVERTSKLALDRGEHAEARAGYERLRSFAQAKSRPPLQMVAEMALARVEIDAMRPMPAARYAGDAVKLALGLKQFRNASNAALLLGSALLLADEQALAVRVLDGAYLGRCTAILHRATIERILAALRSLPTGALDARIDNLLGESLSDSASEARAITVSGRAHDEVALRGALSPALTRPADVRMLARLWLLLVPRSERSA